MEVNLNLGISCSDMLKMKRNSVIQIATAEDKTVLENVIIADTFYLRLKGLMGKKTLNEQQGLLIKPCNSIHTFFMKMNIDIAFLDKENTIVALYKDMRPWKISKIHINSNFVIEGNSGSLSELKIGDKIKIVNKA